jgi:hypothetical protein
MRFSEIVEQAKTLLQRKERISYRALKMEFDLNDEQLDILKEELVDIEELAIDKDGKMLVWAGSSSPESGGKTANPPDSRPQALDPRPISYTPPHLAERIRAVEVTGGERKTITALFADLKSSTALIEGLDPEDARALIDPALQLTMDAVHQYEGYVAQALGDGIFALFGAPLAHEDHPQRAVYAALRMQEEMRCYTDTIRAKGYPPLLMRVGLNTGEVVVRPIRNTAVWSGAFVRARGHAKSALALYDTEEHREHAFLYGQDPAVVLLSYLGWTLWHLGYPDQALTKAMETVRLAQTFQHPFSMGMALNHTAWLH